MIPPRCVICAKSLDDIGDDERWRDHFTVVYFADYQPRVDGRVGGRINGGRWFCTDQAALGKAREHRTAAAALKDIRTDSAK